MQPALFCTMMAEQRVQLQNFDAFISDNQLHPPPNYMTSFLASLESIRHEATGSVSLPGRRLTDPFPMLAQPLLQPSFARAPFWGMSVPMEPTISHFSTQINNRQALPPPPPHFATSPIQEFSCRLCEKMFLSAQQLAHHCCPRIVMKTFQCYKCNKVSRFLLTPN